jgi:hypothetical protein
MIFAFQFLLIYGAITGKVVDFVAAPAAIAA